MRKHLLCIGLLLATTLPLAAERRSPAQQFSSGNSELDSIIVDLNQTERKYKELGIGKLRFNAVVQGTSTCTQSNKLTKLISDILPFHWRKQTYEFEALLQCCYQYPCNVLINPVSVYSNSRHSRRAIREIKPVIMALDDKLLMNDTGSDKAFVSPFSNDGLTQYAFSFNEEDSLPNSQLVSIHFAPKRKNHTLIEGNAWVDRRERTISRIDFKGLIDFGQVDDTLYFSKRGAPFIERSALSINYRYGKTRGVNTFDCLYDIEQFEHEAALKQQPRKLDLTDVYRSFDTHYFEMPEAVWNDSASATEGYDSNSLFNDSIGGYQIQRYRDLFKQLPQRLVGRSYFDAFGTEVRVNGPLNPASLGYDKHNGITFRERIRLMHTWHDGKRLLVTPELGYSFGYHQLRYRLAADWRFAPAHRASLSFSMQNKASGFSSKFKEVVDQTINNYQYRFENDRKNPWRQKMDFEDLDLYFFHHHEIRTEVSYELCNGLMAYGGAFYNYRSPERHGSRAINDELFNQLIDDHYADLNPFLRLEYTPQQYYYYNDGYKQYLASLWPTFTFELAQGIYGIFGSKSNYTRLELDVQQNIPIGANRAISYHIGSGAFIRQKGEYFINYHYFAHSQYPSTWGEKIGGSFTLLNDYWYCSSPAYHQAHFMYESPFMLLNKIPAISKYVIKERIYLGHLIADGKNSYSEFGYGMGNNYFNIGVFGSMIGLKLWDMGVKFTFEIEQHL